ncbi:MAG: bifunctional 5,10-methylenetetrahydrofolate dehydrogenase/5,10-methenyltetrahydrofolate cyclohydrolase [Bacilli bacterium]|jgi:methylenetetrahydrofolate dehydrogenase (NADP+)/methenyltetrahydrofolate cyclohydrolase|nr:bifunctional 5,10-methylenetetrahydrofolate dehydrogenase/5,10-methenyltetrahydrofolate cyclohydrolase [Erysipelotrichia bacterium]
MEIKEYVLSRKKKLFETIKVMKTKPHLAILQVNDDDATNAYIKGKMKDADELGVLVTHLKLPVETKECEILKVVESLNNDDEIHGFIVQLPLPKHVDSEKIRVAINPKKDVDGFHPLSTLKACTPRGILDYLKHLKVDLVGKNAVIIGRSFIVGRPMAKLLIDESANVTVLHSKTKREDMYNFLEMADIVVVAVGQKWLLNDDHTFKETAIIIDVGLSRVDGVLYGDVQPGRNVFLQTPVPGGVGLLTRLALFENLVEIMKNEI